MHKKRRTTVRRFYASNCDILSFLREYITFECALWDYVLQSN